MERQVRTMKLRGAFGCPHCHKDNLCACKTCKPYYENVGIGDHKYCQYTPDGEGFICSYCNKPFSPDQSLEVEYEQYLNSKKNELNLLRPR